jgi:hypothetical protein
MQFCQPHWDRLRAEIEANGLAHMVLTGEVVFQQTVDAIEGKGQENAAFDPLMAMHNKIVEKFVEPLGADGLYIFTGDYCPLCELDRLNPGRKLPENWIVEGTKSLATWLRSQNMTDEVLNDSELE